MSCVLHDWHEGDSNRTSLAKSLYIPRHEQVHTLCCNTEVPDNPFSPKTRFMLYSTAWAPGTSQLMSNRHSRPDDCAHSEASRHTNTRNCLLVSSPAKCSRQQSSTTSQLHTRGRPKQPVGVLAMRKATFDLDRQANQCGCGVHQRDRTSRL